MSLVGNLEDLSLGDILQIISLSQKSGVLALAGDHGSARIVFRQGLVQAACLKGSPNDLRELLISGRFIEPSRYDDLVALSQDQGVPIEETLAREAGLTAERIEQLIREAAEAAVFEMFAWPAGDFSFDVRSQLDPDDPQLILQTGLNAQYLAMEGLRLGDERARDSKQGVDSDALTNPGQADLENDPTFGSEPLELDLLDEVAPTHLQPELEFSPPPDDVPSPQPIAQDSPITHAGEPSTSAANTLVARVIERTEGADELAQRALEVEPLAVAESLPPALTPDTPPPVASVAEGVSSPTSSPMEPQPGCSTKRMPVVLIDPDVMVLEWVKAAIESDFARVHVFQQADHGLARIRQYLIRGESPLVLLSPATRIDPLSGIHGLADFVKRLKAQAPRLVVLGLREDEDAAPSAMPGSLNGVLRRPAREQLALRNQAEDATAGRVLLRALLEILTQEVRQAQQMSGGPGPTPPPTASLHGLRDATAKLQEASSRGEILPVVLDFASEAFARVAILTIREDEVFAIAGRGIAALEVDPLDSAPPISLKIPEAGWIREVLDSGKPHVGGPTTVADGALLECLGGTQPEQAYLGPIESGSSVIALLYGDQATSGDPMPDTTGIEVVLHHAGLALDRAALERALWEADSDGL